MVVVEYALMLFSRMKTVKVVGEIVRMYPFTTSMTDCQQGADVLICGDIYYTCK